MHHITHIKNLKSILESGYLKSRNSLDHNDFEDTANYDIILKRKNVNGDNLNEYVPLHCNHLQETFGISYNYAVCKNNGSKNMIYFIFSPSIIAKYSEVLFYAFHPVSVHGIKCKNLTEFSEKMTEYYKQLPKMNGDKLDFSNKMVQDFFTSEILVKNKIDLKDLQKIFVSNEDTKNKVEEILIECGYENINVEIKKKFFQI